MYPCVSHRQQIRSWLIWLVFLLLLSSCAPTPPDRNTDVNNATPTRTVAIPLHPFVDTWNNIHVFQTFDYNIADPAAVAKRYNFVWGADVQHVAAFHAGNPDIFLTYYMLSNIDWGTFSNERARHDVAYWKRVHPDWILYKCDRTTPAYYNANTPLDFADPAVVAWQVETYAKPASEAGYDGIAVDNLYLGNRYHACGAYVKGKWVTRYTGQFNDPLYRADVITWLARMQRAVHSLRHPLALLPNIAFDRIPPTDPQVQQLVNHVDGILDEGGFTNYASRSYLTGNDWMQRVQFIESVQNHGKAYFLSELFPSVGTHEIQWALANYLMAKEHAASLCITTPQGYGSDHWYGEFDTLIGTPTSTIYQVQNVYFRDYSNGLSIVNPSASNTYLVTLDRGHAYMDLYGHAVNQTIAMPPHSGYVLLNWA